MTGIDKRRSFRVNDSVYVKYDILTEREFREGLDRRKLRLGLDDGASARLVDVDARLSQAMFKLSRESDSLGRCITLLNDKINIIIDQLPALLEAKSTLAKLPLQTCDVGADGMLFATNERLSRGTKLHIQFLLESDRRYVETFCTVVRETAPPDDNAGLRYGIAVEFNGMKAEQREILIQHMFHRESDSLRMRRLEIEAMEE